MAPANNGDGDRKSPLMAGLQASLIAGTAGFLVGGTVGIAKSKKPIALWTLLSSLQWALLGGTYWGMRTAFMQQLPDEDMTPRRRLLYSTLSGGLSFAIVGAVTRGRQNIIPGTITGSVLGITGQAMYNFLDQRHTQTITAPSQEKSLWEKLVSAKWSPITPLSDEEYIDRLAKKLTRVEVEIAILDDEIAELEAQKELKQDISRLREDRNTPAS